MTTTSPQEIYRLIQAMNIAAVRTAKASPHFTWRELLVHRTPVELQDIQLKHLEKLARLAEKLEEVRETLGGRPIRITSGWRDMFTNRRVGGAYASRHLVGEAADIVVAGLSPKQVQARLESSWEGGLGYGSTFTHLDIRGYQARFGY
jgi:uncharacterized protein YcbK (DUF882 family)